MSLHDVWQLGFTFLPKKPVCVQPVDENLSTDAGLLIFRQWDEQQQLTEGFSRQLDDRRRDPDHSMLEMVRSRLFGILALVHTSCGLPWLLLAGDYYTKCQEATAKPVRNTSR